MTTAIVTLALCLSGSVVAVALLAKAALSAKGETMDAAKMYRDQIGLTDSMRDERDEWKVRHDTASAQLAAAKVRLVTAEAQRNEANAQAVTELIERVKGTDDLQTAADVVNRLFRLPFMSKAGSAPAGDGDR